MTDYLWVVLAAALLLVLALLMWMLRDIRKLKRQCQLLEAQAQRSSEDVAGLCSAALAVDKRLALSESQLLEVVEGMETWRERQSTALPASNNSPQTVADTDQGYQAVIQKIRQGASVDDLVRDYGLTRDEAVLLRRLHAGKV